MADWGVYWTAIGTIAATIFGAFGLYKILVELQRANEQRQTEIEQRSAQIAEMDRNERLKRTEFFLSQHRRLFDDPDLYEVLGLIDGDDEKLANPVMWDKKRKFLTFFEEIALLVRSDQLDKQVAFYMFGYYANCVIEKPNFSEGIETSRANWGLLYEFSEQAEAFRIANEDGPPAGMLL
jgi:hypothetical protein